MDTKPTYIPSKILAIIFLFLGLVEGLIASLFLISLPSESGAFFGLSATRMGILIGILVPLFICLFLLITVIRSTESSIFDICYTQSKTYMIVVAFLISIICFLFPVLLTTIHQSTGNYSYLAYSQRLLPLFAYLAALFFQMSVFLLNIHKNRISQIFEEEKSFLKLWGVVFAGLVLFVILLVITGLGLIPDLKGWGAPTVPLLEWQIWMGILFCLLFRLMSPLPLIQRIINWWNNRPVLSAWLISIFIWCLAMGIWSSQPVPPGFFATPPRAPNYEIYPFSDAAYYDFHAQSLLIGLGYRGESIPPRPLYILFLAAAHLIAGQDYTRVILLQTALLAFFPVIIFWIGKKLSSTTIGFVTSLFIILREWTSIVSTPFTSDISNSKLLFADLPAALFISLVVLVSIYWMRNPKKWVLSLLTGGILGISLLIRTQIIIILPVIWLFYWFVCLRQKTAFMNVLLATICFLVGFGLTVSPWLIRSYRISGQFVFDDPESQTRVMVQRYYPDVELTEFDRKPGETTGTYNQRLSSAIRQQLLTNPIEVAHFIVSHFLNSEIANLQVFPVRYSIQDFGELLKPEHAFWEDWKGKANPLQTAIMMVNLAVLAAGVIYLYKRSSIISLFPLTVNLAYNFSNAIARNSGWRYLLPVDWVFILYFAAGIYALVNLGNGLWVKARSTLLDSDISGQHVQFPFAVMAGISSILLLIGIIPIIAENSFPRIYPAVEKNSISQIILKASSNLPDNFQKDVSVLLSDPDSIIMHGRMLYPRFYDVKDGEENTGKTGYTVLPYARYVFLVAGQPEGTVIFPHTESDLPLRNSEEIYLVGCMDGLAIKARMLVLPDETPSVFTANPPIPWTCSSTP
ncbi:hypothetical protein ADM99_05585 [Leptolinea tardivitalis]|uniref:Glycosyltransferase RgtA/B/C/D-like domain-containing protein n=1 Tax=Leptolinea tardivitalis TaxID=229920 RepID=A0A0N8GLI4_9CHLR|nr:hypothetical protein ADM99_05585 [Leptolinea tardivitalis]GAP21107.1 hypothetical protein LTAR_01313 [Leptolinea tardivitalis]